MKNPVPNPVIINPHAPHPTSLSSLCSSIWLHRELIYQMTQREVLGRYRGSAMGLAWSFFNPLLMLIVYTFVFSEIFKARWINASAEESRVQFALILFVGMIVLGFFCDLLNRAPHLVISNVNYVKKVVFPLEVLPVIAACAALFHALISLFALLLAFLIFNGYLHWTLIYLPFVFFPLILITTGFAWLLASLGVFIRDISQGIGIITSLLMFLTPVFYPISSVPEAYRPFLLANPLTFMIEQARGFIIWGYQPDWLGLLAYTLSSIFIAWIGYFWFQKTRKGFADVL